MVTSDNKGEESFDRVKNKEVIRPQPLIWYSPLGAVFRKSPSSPSGARNGLGFTHNSAFQPVAIEKHTCSQFSPTSPPFRFKFSPEFSADDNTQVTWCYPSGFDYKCSIAIARAQGRWGLNSTKCWKPQYEDISNDSKENDNDDEEIDVGNSYDENLKSIESGVLRNGNIVSSSPKQANEVKSDNNIDYSKNLTNLSPFVERITKIETPIDEGWNSFERTQILNHYSQLHSQSKSINKELRNCYAFQGTNNAGKRKNSLPENAYVLNQEQLRSPTTPLFKQYKNPVADYKTAARLAEDKVFVKKEDNESIEQMIINNKICGLESLNMTHHENKQFAKYVLEKKITSDDEISPSNKINGFLNTLKENNIKRESPPNIPSPNQYNEPAVEKRSEQATSEMGDPNLVHKTSNKNVVEVYQRPNISSNLGVSNNQFINKSVRDHSYILSGDGIICHKSHSIDHVVDTGLKFSTSLKTSTVDESYSNEMNTNHQFSDYNNVKNELKTNIETLSKLIKKAEIKSPVEVENAPEDKVNFTQKVNSTNVSNSGRSPILHHYTISHSPLKKAPVEVIVRREEIEQKDNTTNYDTDEYSERPSVISPHKKLKMCIPEGPTENGNSVGSEGNLNTVMPKHHPEQLRKGYNISPKKTSNDSFIEMLPGNDFNAKKEMSVMKPVNANISDHGLASPIVIKHNICRDSVIERHNESVPFVTRPTDKYSERKNDKNYGNNTDEDGGLKSEMLSTPKILKSFAEGTFTEKDNFTTNEGNLIRNYCSVNHQASPIATSPPKHLKQFPIEGYTSCEYSVAIGGKQFHESPRCSNANCDLFSPSYTVKESEGRSPIFETVIMKNSSVLENTRSSPIKGHLQRDSSGASPVISPTGDQHYGGNTSSPLRRGSVLVEARNRSPKNGEQQKMNGIMNEGSRLTNTAPLFSAEDIALRSRVLILLWVLLGERRLREVGYPTDPVHRILWRAVDVCCSVAGVKSAAAVPLNVDHDCGTDMLCFRDHTHRFLEVCAPTREHWKQFGWASLTVDAVVRKIYDEELLPLLRQQVLPPDIQRAAMHLSRLDRTPLLLQNVTSPPQSLNGDSVSMKQQQPSVIVPTKKKRGRPAKISHKVDEGGRIERVMLWRFLLNLLEDPRNSACIHWVQREEGIFRILNTDWLARLWGRRHGNPRMTYEKMARAMRTYYRSKVLQPVPRLRNLPRKLVYKFNPAVIHKVAAMKLTSSTFSGRGLNYNTSNNK